MRHVEIAPGLRYSIRWGRGLRVVLEITAVTTRKVKYIFRGLDEKFKHLSNVFLLDGCQTYSIFRRPFIAWLRARGARLVRERRRRVRIKRKRTSRNIEHVKEVGHE